MASLHKDPRGKSPYYYCAYTLPDGRRAFRSTKLKDRKKAWEVCLSWENSADRARRGILTEAQARKVLNQILENTGESPIQTVSIADYFNHWLSGKELANKPRTAERYRVVVEHFLASLGSRARHLLDALSVRDIEKFRDESINEGKAPKTVSTEIKILRIVLNGARRQGRLLVNPAEAVPLPKSASHTRDVFSPAQIQMLLAVADDEWITAILCGYYLGARLTDVTNLTWQSVDLTGGAIQFEQGKTGKTVTVPLHPVLEAHLSKLAGDDPHAFLCPSLQKRSVGGRSGLSQTFARIMREAGIDQKQIHGKGKNGRRFSRLSFHSLRHTFTSSLANAGVRPEVRQKLTGHASQQEHAKYTHLELQPLKEAIATLPVLQTTASS